MFEMIPADRLHGVMNAIQSIWSDRMPEKVTVCSSGSNSIILTITFDNVHYILRVMDFIDDLSNRKNQITCLKKAAVLGLAPCCLYENAEDGVLITEFIASQKIIKTKEWLSEIANSLKILHQDQTFPVPHQPLFPYMDELAGKLRGSKLSLYLNQYLDKIDEIKLLLTPHLELTSCHNDLNFSNLLFNGEKTYFIDWEAAGLEDPFFDLAMVCNEFISNDEDRVYFISQYFGRALTALEVAKLNGMRQIAYCYLALHFLEHALNSGLLLSIDYPIEPVPTVSEWIEGFDRGEYQLNSADEFLFYAFTKIKESNAQIESCEFSSLAHQKMAIK